DDGGVLGVYTKSLEKKDDREGLITSLREQDFEELNLLTPGISWNPEGTQLAISAKSGGEDAIYIVDAKDGDYEKLKFGIKAISSVSWSHDGKNLAFIGSDSEQTDIYLYNIKDKKIKNITNDVFTDKIPVWSNDSKSIYFISDRGENTNINFTKENFLIWKYNYKQSDIYSINLESGQIKRITNNSKNIKTSIAISSDGNKLLYASDDNGIGNIYEMNLISGEVKPKTNSLSSISQLSLSKDGTKLLFSTMTGGGYDIFLMRFPFEKNLPYDTLPLTKFESQLQEKEKLNKTIKDTLNKDTLTQAEQQLISYGDFELDFSRQELVKANRDIINDDFQNSNDKSLKDIEDQSYPEHEYKIKFSMDAALFNPWYSSFNGLQGASQMLFSDVLGDHQIYINAYLLMDLKNSSFLVQYSYLPKIIDYSFSAFHYSGWAYNQAYYYRYRNWGLSLNTSYPLDLFNRIEFGVNWMNVSKEHIDGASPDDISRMLIVPELKYIHDNALWSGFGPHQGSRYNIGIKGTPKLGSNGVSFVTITGDFRKYIPVTNYMSLALRAAGGKSLGANPRNFLIGGTDYWINADWMNITTMEPEDFAFMEFPMPLRGWAIGEAKGNQYFLTNAEFRFPLFRALLAGPVPILIQDFQGCIFYDMGGAWNGNISDFRAAELDIEGKSQVKNLLMSTGVGARLYVLGIPLKIDVAWRNLFYTWSEPSWLFSLGFDW
ncbi:MAG: PD40 domain-containing protein, partial [Ignavibacteriae bacterium]|nr:PD40 domain-containing protein [Ignavibacteriota bacterium]